MGGLAVVFGGARDHDNSAAQQRAQAPVPPTGPVVVAGGAHAPTVIPQDMVVVPSPHDAVGGSARRQHRGLKAWFDRATLKS